MNLNKLKVFITGGAGFIGSHIAEELLKKGAIITIYDNFSFGSINNLSHIKNNLKIINGDILDYEKLSSSMKGHDIVSHHAAQLEIFLGIKSPLKDLEINTIGALNVFKAARQNNISKVVNASSACIYGQTNKSTNETFYPQPNWEYGVSKLAAEKYANIYSNYYNLPIINLRYAITFGEREWYRRALTIFIKRALSKLPLIIFDEGQQIRDFIYVKDAVKLHNLCLEKDEIKQENYNVGSGIPITIAQLANIVSKITCEVEGFKPEIIYEKIKEGEFSKIVKGKKRNQSELKMMLLDITKAKNDLNWNLTTSLHQGIKNQVLWYSKNKNFWNKIKYTH